MAIDIKQTLYNTQKELFVLLSFLVTYHDNIANPPLREALSQKEFSFLLTALVTYNNNIIRLTLMFQQQKGVTTQMSREAVSNNINSPIAFTPSSSDRDNGINSYSDFTLSSSNEGNQGLSNKDTKNLNITSVVVEPVIDTVEEDKSVKEEDEDYVQVEDDKSSQSYVINGYAIMSSSSWSSLSDHQHDKGGRGRSGHDGGQGGRGSSSHHDGRRGRPTVTEMNPKEKKVKEKNDLSLNVNNPVTPNDACTITSSSNTTTPSDAAAATTPSTAVTPTDAYIITPSDVAAAATIASTALASTNAKTGEESTRYISPSLETTKPVLVDKEGTTTQVRKVSLMSPTNPDAHTDPAFTDPALLITRTINPKVYSKVKKKKKMKSVPFKKDQRFWTIDEAKEDADKDDNHDGISVCTDAACSDACSDFMPSFLNVTKCSLFMSMPLSDVTKPRTNRRKSDTHTNKLLATTFKDQSHCATLKPVTNNI